MSINQSTTQSNDQSINQSIDQLTGQYIDQTTCPQLITQSIDQTKGQTCARKLISNPRDWAFREPVFMMLPTKRIISSNLANFLLFIVSSQAAVTATMSWKNEIPISKKFEKNRPDPWSQWIAWKRQHVPASHPEPFPENAFSSWAPAVSGRYPWSHQSSTKKKFQKNFRKFQKIFWKNFKKVLKIGPLRATKSSMRRLTGKIGMKKSFHLQGKFFRIHKIGFLVGG